MIKVPGILKSTKAVGWYIDEYNKAQVSMNLTNYKVTSIEAAFEEVRKQANKRGVRVTGSEIVGLVPKESLLNAGIYYLRKQKRSTAIPDTDIIDIAIDSLGLNEISEFKQDSSIVENRIISFDRLIDLKINTFSNEVSSESPAPGGGSVSALAGALASSLVSMVVNLSFGKKEYEKNIALIEKIGIDGQKIKDNLLQLVDADTKAFDEIMRAFRMKKKTPEDIESREEKIQLATMHAINIPLSTMEYSLTALSLSKKIMKIGNKNSISDAGVAAELSAAAINGAYMNVLINLKDINSNEYKSKILKKSEKLIIRSKKELEISRSFIYKNIK
jgi:glutamate formiminotransferase/formiminotetrahydrofolate cyclodeaminase